MQLNPITYLHWDSNFFGLKVGKVEINSHSKFDAYINEPKNDYQLVYLFSIEELLVVNEMVKLVDTKVTFEKNISNISSELANAIIEINDKNILQYEDELLALALLSGKYSRFKLDTQFPHGSFEKLYATWLNNALNGSFGNLVLGYTIQDELVGFVTVDTQADMAKIGLIAVNESYSGKGIGKSLMHAAMYYAKKQCKENMQVVTQLQNKPACALYQKLGFDMVDKVHIYHHWV